MRRMRELEDDGRHILLDQYGNPVAPLSYAPVSELLIDKVGEFDFIVGAVGSGASTAGVIRPYRSVFPCTRLVGVDTFGSIILGQRDRKRLLRGLGNSLMFQAMWSIHFTTSSIGSTLPWRSPQRAASIPHRVSSAGQPQARRGGWPAR